jgi:L-cystine transport system substrate-binding protein
MFNSTILQGEIMSKYHSIGIALLSVTVAVAALTGCAKKPAGDAQSGAPAVTKVRAAHTQTYVPYDFINEKGESDGFEVQVLKAVDALIPDYEFDFVGTSDDDLLIGIESGKYGLGTKGAWITEERKKKYVIPENPVGVSVIGIAFRKENADQIKDMESFAKFSGKLVPIAPQNAQWAIVEDYNNTHPDAKVNLVASDIFQVTDAYNWLMEKRYDAYFAIKLSYQNSVENADAPLHSYADRLTYAPYRGIPTYALFNRNLQDLADKYDAAILELQKQGKIAELSQKYFGEDIFQYVSK